MNPFFGGTPPPRPCAGCGTGLITYEQVQQEVESMHESGWRIPAGGTFAGGIRRKPFTMICEDLGWPVWFHPECHERAHRAANLG